MTVIIGYVANDRVFMGADSNTAEHPNGQIWERDFPKIWRCEMHDDLVLLGFAGASGLEIAVRFGPRLPPPIGDDPDAWAQKVAEHISEIAISHKFLTDNDNDMDAIVMLAWRDRLWEVNFHYALPCPHIGAAGAGRQIAWGALAALHEHCNWAGPAEKVVMALKVACELNDACRPPVVLEVTDAVPS